MASGADGRRYAAGRAIGVPAVHGPPRSSKPERLSPSRPWPLSGSTRLLGAEVAWLIVVCIITFVHGMSIAVYVGAIVVALGAVAALAIKRPRRAEAVVAEPALDAA